MDKMPLIDRFVTCPACGIGPRLDNAQLICKGCGRLFNLIDGDIVSTFRSTDTSTDFVVSKWNQLYTTDSCLKKLEHEYRQLFLNDVKRQVLKHAASNTERAGVYLELGCGPGFLGEELARDGWFFLGIDFSIEVLKALKKRLNLRGITNYLLIHGDIQDLPVRSGSLDLVYGGGVVEHSKSPQLAIENVFKVLAPNGVSFNTVPYLNIGNLIYRSQWGGIPNLPGLKQLSELIHIKILRGKHMLFGYELQFTKSQLRKLHVQAGFQADNIIIDRFDCYVQLQKVRNSHLRKFLLYLCKNNSQFWPAIKVIGIKK